jgi:hypothetical protein
LAFIVTLVCIAVSMVMICEDFVTWMFSTAIGCFFMFIMFVIGGYFDPPKEKHGAAQVAQQKDKPPPTYSVDPPPTKDDPVQGRQATEQEKSDDPILNHFAASKGADRWMAASEMSIQKARVVCDDGVQLKVSMWVDQDDKPVTYAVWTRLHTNGSPYTCSESKNPEKEMSQ